MSTPNAVQAPERGVEAQVPDDVVRRAYVVCCMTRTGSSLLCDSLGRLGFAGKPAEYFDLHDSNRNFWVNQLKVEAPSQYLDKVIAAGSTPNGVFGTKLHWYQMPALMKEFGLDAKSIDLDGCLALRFAQRKYVWLRRRNKVAQAISNYRAIKTAIWRVGPNLPEKTPKTTELVFDAERIEHHVSLAEHFEKQWDIWFKLSRQPGLVLVYEEFCQQYETTIRAVCKYLELGHEGFEMPAPRFDKQADDISLEWEEKYRKLKGLAPDIQAAPIERLPGQVALRPRLNRGGRRASITAPAVVAAAAAQGAAQENSPHRLIAFDLGTGQNVRLGPASNRRAWMDATPERHANRCLPLVIANQHGWFMHSPCRVEASWDGGEGLASVVVRQAGDYPARFASSHFGSGIITFSVNFLFRTPPGVNLHLRGPANLPKDGISALEGIIETDWSQATFTVNWQFTRPNHTVVFEKDEPIAMFSPVRRGDIENFHPEILPIAADSELEAGYRAWSQSRNSFVKDLKVPNSPAQKARWQRHYTRGETLTSSRAESHQTKLFVNEFQDRRGAVTKAD
jgi:LPS sulfotransferase NodH